MRVARILAVLMASSASVALAQQHVLAPTPPMGWNSWDSYGLTINEQQFRDNVRVEADKLKPFGWTYAVIDEGWFLRNPQDRPHPERLQYEIDANGRYIPVPNRFPSALLPSGENAGFAALGRWVHAQGLRFGIHIVRGIPRESVRRNLPIEGSSFHVGDAADTTDACPWDPTNWGVKRNAAGQAWYDALLRQYAAWGVDFLKVDCIADHPYKADEIRQIHLAIEHSGRLIVLSLSPGPTSLSHADEVASLSQMWRVSNDVWDIWASDKPFPRSVKAQFPVLAEWASHTKTGAWPDADMLPFGELRPKPDVGPGPRKSRLSLTEERTMLTLWSMARSPLILGANLTLLDEPTVRLITDRDLIRIDQHATAGRQVLQDGDLIAWTADLPGGERALAIFNLGDTPLLVDRPLAALGLPAQAQHLRESGNTRELRGSSIHKDLDPHGSAVFFVR